MVIHQAAGVNVCIISPCCGFKVFKKFFPVTFAFEDGFGFISSWGYIIEGAGEGYSLRASHIGTFFGD